MPQLHETEYGRRFFGAQLPNLVKQLERCADALERIAQLAEQGKFGGDDVSYIGRKLIGSPERSDE